MKTQAEEYVRAGDLDKALKALTEDVRANPAKPELRVFLFQLLSVLGDWDRALTQLNVAAELDLDCKLMAQACRPALECEALRETVFAGEKSPLVFGQPSEWVALLTQVLPLLAKGKLEAAAELRDRAFEAAPASGGTIDGQSFQWMADADPRLGPVLEVVLEGRYYWVPFAAIREIRIEKPVDLRDAVWAPANFVWTNQGTAVGFIPTRYAGTASRNDSSARLARRTDWADLGHGFFAGTGQRVLATDQGEYPLLSVRQIVLDNAPVASAG
jgi:type VI secretion system protein ImpE